MKTTFLKLTQLLTLLLFFSITACSSERDDDATPTVPDNPDQMEEMEDDSTDDIGGNDQDGDGIPDEEDIDVDGDGLIEISSLDALNDLRNNLDFSEKGSSETGKNDFIGFELTKDLDFENPNDYDDSTLLDSYTSGDGWEPLGSTEFGENGALTIENRFQGIFDGNGFTISNLYINRPEQDYLGLFGATSLDATISNLNVEINEIIGQRIIGGIAGLGAGNFDNCSVSGNISSVSTGQAMIGLLVGRYEGGLITDCNTTGVVTAESASFAGGLMGRLVIDPFTESNALVANSYSEATVTADQRVGGLVGGFSLEDAVASTIQINNAYATGNVIGENSVGGLVGTTLGSTISSCYATGTINNIGNSEFDGDSGGLLGYAFSTTISACYATGDVIGNPTGSCKGGLAGFVYNTTITTSFSTGTIEGNPMELGGLTGRCQAASPSTISNTNYWDIETSGIPVSRGEAQGLTTAELQNPVDASGIYTTWDPMVWNFGTSEQYPVLLNMPNGVENQRQ
jgi:hypothetical protein